MRKSASGSSSFFYSPNQSGSLSLSALRGCSGSERRKRLLLLTVPLLIWTIVIAGRLVSLQLRNPERWQQAAARQHSGQIKLAAERGAITDRSGRLIAVSVPAASIYVRPGQLPQSQNLQKQAARKLALLTGVSETQILRGFQEKSPFIWIKRQLPREISDQISELKISGVGTLLESRRYYPFGEAASVLLGRVGTDGEGLSGLELQYEKQLRGASISRRVARDGIGNVMQVSTDETRLELPKGRELRLTLDAHIQQIVDQELEAGRISAHAKRAMALIVDAESGEILAISQAPRTNLNNLKVNSEDLHNLLVETVYEPGSTFKPLIAAAALEAGVVASAEIIDCQQGQLNFGHKVIKDVHPVGQVPFRDVIVRSSNIGMTRVGLRLGSERLHAWIELFGFGQRSGIELSGESPGIFRDLKDWAAVDVATHSFGQGIAVTPLQMVRAVSAIANGGYLPTLSLSADNSKRDFPKILSSKTANLVKSIMIEVTEKEYGTGRRAAIPGVRVAGKTGTAQKPRKDGRGYSDGLYVSSFLGFVDASQIGVSQNLAAIVLIDEPDSDSIYGGVLAAPVFKNIMQRTLRYLVAEAALSRGESDNTGKIPAEPFGAGPEQPASHERSPDLLVRASYQY